MLWSCFCVCSLELCSSGAKVGGRGKPPFGLSMRARDGGKLPSPVGSKTPFGLVLFTKFGQISPEIPEIPLSDMARSGLVAGLGLDSTGSRVEPLS